ncbi:DUF1350 family protein [Alkalinema sp. FACHB-956]|uniref:DUF1350 family protein n=1 Tax=Alkalinema sp. FACHB-956 TaxID=2692768 RepID=UPI0016835775|nr:DUF1350 family protein [Alkalinema sp. FACHB-956]MBD2326155.1 DUF1350 family protein [Alkalinema sp. FACHB-956]
MMDNAVSIEPQFQRLSSSWVAIHPHPKGIIQFIGGAFFGSFPTLSYQYFLKQLFQAGYTIISLPFRFTFNHWSVALDLLEEHYAVRLGIIEQLAELPDKPDRAYDYRPYLAASNYCWVGHSLGCKYIALLELLNDGSDQVLQDMAAIADAQSETQMIQYRLQQMGERLEQRLQSLPICATLSVAAMPVGITDQASLLLAPVIQDLNAAIPLPFLQRAFQNVGLQVLPTVEQTYQLIDRSQSFNLTRLITFDADKLAIETCDRLLQRHPNALFQALKGKHLEPVGIQLGRSIVDFNPLDKWSEPIVDRALEPVVIGALEALQQIQTQVIQPTLIRQ